MNASHRAAVAAPERPAREPIDWSQLWHPGPRRVFTADELARGGGDRPSRTLVVLTALTLLLTAQAVLQAAPPQATAMLTALLAGGLVAAASVARRLWDNPSRRLLSTSSWCYALVCGLLAGGLRWRLADPLQMRWAVLTLAVLSALACTAWWFLAVYRAEQISGRLREQAERERAVEMARQLAAAQIQPHFLFNSLAALQHWVQVKDDRAAPLLDALCAYLRATLPLFNRARLALGDEAESVRQYLAVMGLRLGERLRCSVHVDAGAAAVQVPPGLLLTLAENAIEHGVQRSLSGAEVVLDVRCVGGRVAIEVRDSGPGLADGVTEGVGLSNTRARLAQAYGATASLQLTPGADGGCVARIELPFSPPSEDPRP